MDLEQLLSFVRYQKGQKAGWDALDEVLTAVRDSDRMVKEAEGKVKAAEQRLATIEQECSDKIAHAEARVSGVEAGIAERKGKYLAELQAAEARVNEKRDAAAQEVSQLSAIIDDLKLKATGLAGEVKILEQDKLAAEKNLARVKEQLAEISKALAR